jgi:hypothetical protein
VTPEWSVSLQLLRGISDIQPPDTVQKDCINEWTSPDEDGVNFYARPLKVKKSERFLKVSLMHVLSYLSILGFWQKAKSCLWPGLLFK